MSEQQNPQELCQVESESHNLVKKESRDHRAHVFVISIAMNF